MRSREVHCIFINDQNRKMVISNLACSFWITARGKRKWQGESARLVLKRETSDTNLEGRIVLYECLQL